MTNTRDTPEAVPDWAESASRGYQQGRKDAEDEIARLRHLLAVAIDPDEDTAHEWCDEDSGGTHRFDRASFEVATRAALAPGEPHA